MEALLARAIGRALGSDVASSRPVGGGDIHHAHAVALADGRRVFVKTSPGAAREMFATEARGLAWLAEARALRIPEVLAVSPADETPAFLVLQLLEPGRRPPDFDERLGRGLATLHRTGAPSFGLDHDNFIGSLPQANDPAPDWPTFYRDRRLDPLVRRAASRGLASGALLAGLSQVMDRIDVLCGPAEPPSRLHGDLWGGNLHTDPDGAPCLIDPAVYGGDREVDLAMMRLFGGFSGRVFAAYDEAWPLASGHEDRVPLYQLYPLLVHLNLFGSSYAGSLRAALDSLL